MKQITTILAFLISFSVYAQTPCESGMAGSFPCSGYDLQSQIPLGVMNSTRANDSWGWTDPQDGKEYAIICLIEGTAFIDISDPVNPIYLGQLPTENNSSTWRDAKTYNNYAFIVSEDSGHGMQIFDLTRLRNVANPPVVFTEDAHYSGFGSAHNIVINEATGYAYGVGTNMNSGGPHFINIQDPLTPIGVGSDSTNGYCHDAQVVIYNGPDTDYTGREILFGSYETQVVIVDVTDKNNPQTISTIGYTNVEYTHQGWLTEDHRYFLLGDEQDEINLGLNSRTIVFDFNDLDNPQFHFDYLGPTAATDHNGYVKGNTFYISNNAAGLRAVDISDIANMNMMEEGFFDSYLPDNNAGYNGAWNVYPFFESGNIVISDRTQGFLLVTPSVLGMNDLPYNDEFTVYPNPASENITVSSKSMELESITIYTGLGQKVLALDSIDSYASNIVVSNFPPGIYFVNINNLTVKKILIN
ncbi:choice-of-anchor B domain-containing protein [Ulvibacter sp. MAR_2010_11]|uniref:choice-of-anchor B family protein n=1 Tax=Ulvibacter sp. MAR_2010_11 TaxID=1250229 RepID=UPI000C2C4E30|nr:choice-of-anchor B family protein [Ulvibacter sp. MAR_2010_11]PKA82766.1 choice-of-anchor B domain-containing protein [Ulvibacter sp. MAR_2010_11]